MGCSYFLPFAQGASDQFLASANFGTRRPAAEAGGQCTVLWLPCTTQLSAQNSTHVMRLLWLVVMMVVLSMVVHNSNAMKEDTALALHTNCRCLLDCNLCFEYYLRRSALLCTQWSQYSYFMRSNHFIMGSGDQ